MESEFLVALTTFDSRETAQELVRELVEEGLVACATIIPTATSVYRWKGAVESTDESVVLMKLGRRDWDALDARIRDRHPYDVPELIALPIVAGSAPYLAWLQAETKVT